VAHRAGESGLILIQNVLQDVVAEWILNQRHGTPGNGCNQSLLLVASGVVYASLDDAASMTVSADCNTIVRNGVEDELRVGVGQMIETFLYDMVAIEVLDHANDLIAKCIDDSTNLVDRQQMRLDSHGLITNLFLIDHVFNHLLQGSGAVLIECDMYHLMRRVVDEHGSMVLGADLQQLLAQIIAERI